MESHFARVAGQPRLLEKGVAGLGGVRLVVGVGKGGECRACLSFAVVLPMVRWDELLRRRYVMCRLSNDVMRGPPHNTPGTEHGEINVADPGNAHGVCRGARNESQCCCTGL
jgi:hypothetical protein